MSYTANPAEVEYRAATNQQFIDPSPWWQPAFAHEQPTTVFTATATQRHVGYLPPGPYETKPLNRRHTVDISRASGHGYAPQYSIGLAAGFPPFTSIHQYYPSNFESGLTSPPSSSRPSFSSSSNSYSPTAPNRHINHNDLKTQGSPISVSAFPTGTCPFSPAVSAQSPTQSQLTQPPQIQQLDEIYPYVPQSEPICDPYVPGYDPESMVNTAPPAETTFCLVPGCKSKFTGEYQKGNLKRHLKSNHPELLESPADLEKLKCSLCPQSFKRSDARKKHELRTHGIGPVPLKKHRYASS
ncbi:hypothetical protein PMIN07_006195 [Paraphaeosphaeria minitans]